MANSLKLQMDVKNNAEDLRRYMLDLQSWEDEMKQKEAGLKSKLNNVSDLLPPRNKIKRNNAEKGFEKKSPESEKKPKKIHAYDYSSWDKYDADKACAELDEEEVKFETSQTSTLENEEREEEKKDPEECKSNMKNLDEAFFEKELGNQFVRKEKWEDAIKCYTRAIDLDSQNAIYYANRALCFIKLKNFRSAEVDSTVAIQLDNTYVKAYQRRAVARLALGQAAEALSDYREIVKMEPKNAYVIAEITKLEKKVKDEITREKGVKVEKKIFDPTSIFKSDTNKEVLSKSSEEIVKEKKTNEKMKVQGKDVDNKIIKDCQVPKNVKDTNEVEKLEMQKPTVKEADDDVFDKLPDGFTLVTSIHVPPHLRSRKTLQRIPVKDTIFDSETFDKFVSMCNSISEENVIHETEPKKNVVKTVEIEEHDAGNLPVPETFLQFQQGWKIVKKNPELSLDYLQKTTPKKLYRILRHNLEIDLFSELLTVLACSAETNSELVYSVLCELTGVDRFGSLTLFFSQSDKENVMACIDRLKSTRTESEIQDLRKFYQVGRD